MAEAKANTWGGARRGAGRKKKWRHPVQLRLSLTKSKKTCRAVGRGGARLGAGRKKKKDAATSRELSTHPGTVRRRNYYARNRERVLDRERRRRYGITPEEYRRLLAESGGRCGICRNEIKLHIDHCHRTGVIRGMLCDVCNRGLGFFHDDPVRCQAAADYLRRSYAAPELVTLSGRP